MIIEIYFMIAILFLVLILWVWNNTKEFDTNFERVGFILIGLLFLSFITYVIFNISKIGINYTNKEVLSKVRKIAMLLFIPINGFISLPHIANIIADILLKRQTQETLKRKVVILGIIIIITIVFEIRYLHGFQNGIMQILNNK